MPDPAPPNPSIEFSIVSAVYNVGRYLDDYISSVEAQRVPRDSFEVIAVDDGSTDDSLEILRRWERDRPGLVTVLTQANAGQAAARNAGMAVARGRWVTFVDPDDMLDPDYLREVATFMAEQPGASMYAANRLVLDEATGRVSNTHPLRGHFRLGNRLRDITHYPEYFHGHAPTAFFPTVELRRLGIEFDPRIRPNFEDGHFCSAFLLGQVRPSIGFVASARYLYRTRKDNTSTLQGSFANPGRFTTVMRHGFLDILERGSRSQAGGSPPEWLQNFVIYELTWYFSSQEKPAGVITAAVGPVAEEFHALMRDVLAYLDDDVIAGYTVRAMKPAWTDILLHAYRPEPWHQEYGHVSAFDDGQALVRISYRYCGPPPAEELFSGGELVQPTHAKVRDLAYHGRTLMFERIVWLAGSRSVRIKLDGRDLNLTFEVPRRRHSLRPGQIRSGTGRAATRTRGRSSRKVRLTDRVVRRLARSVPVRFLLRGSWVLMDRIADAGDSGERLFEYVRANRPDIRAWLVVSRDAPDWRRLRRAHGWRVIAHGSLRWKLTMANCRHLISSHVDVPIVRPPALMPWLRPDWSFTFLQHGVIKDDLSGWLNPKSIDLLVTSTPQEYASIAGDHTPYVLTTKEVKLTGLPRFDRLRRLGERFPPHERDLLLLAPTWRVRLVRPLLPGAHVRDIDPAFFESDFATNWLGLVRSETLARLCDEERLTLGFLPHPVLQPALPAIDLPVHVRPLSFAEHDAQELFARAAVMVTDYSSMAFNAAYIDRPLVYFQFDRDRVEGGEHLGRRGYFDYERDGFGPVTRTIEEAERAIVDVVRAGRHPSPPYQARIDASFPLRDGRCCERVVAEIERLTRRVPPAEAAIPTPPPRMPAPIEPDAHR